MSLVTPLQSNFTGGELSPLMLGRVDHEVWKVSSLELTGWVPRPQGPIEACPGFEYVASAAGPCRLIPFEPYLTQSYIIEMSALKFRFYTNDVLLTVATVPVEVAHPYTQPQVLGLDYTFAADGDTMWFWHRSVAPKQLFRTGAASFTLGDFTFANGPFEDRNTDKTLTVQASAQTGAVTLVANQPLFDAGDVGGLFEMEFIDLSTIPHWMVGMTVSAGMLVVSVNGKVYQHSAGTITGSAAPTHNTGTQYDGINGNDVNGKGPYGCAWTYKYSAIGRLKITGFTDATHVSATVVQDLASTNATYRWRFGAFSPKRGWPEHGAIIQDRLVLSKDNNRYASQIGLYNDFDRFNENGDIGDDQAFISPLTDPNPVAWMQSGNNLFTGGAREEGVMQQSSAARGIAPGNIRNTVNSRRGSATVRPVDLDGKPVFLQRNRRKVLRITDTTYERLGIEDLTRYADHVGNSPMVEFAKQVEPMPLLWAVREDGMLWGCLLMPEEAILGWFRRPLGGGMLARSIVAVTAPDGTREDLWLAAETVSGAWFVMKLAPFRNAGEYDENGIMCDAALTYDGVSASIFTAAHLADKEVEVVADGAVLGLFTLDGTGTVDLSAIGEGAFSKVMLGLPFPCRWRSLPPEAGGDNGPAMFKIGRTAKVWLRVQNSLGLRVTVDDEPNAAQDLESLMTDSVMDTALPFMTLDIPLDMVGGYDRRNVIQIDRTSAKQSTILAIMGQLEKANG
ncbi:hypothetical protein [Novosphingobium sp. FKTRR1]|uniref:hypothetical protein n=1 Tax=Novosphingobium sp. FKTRR1 TaxID=2879118 RepID=UPI001CEFCDDB|nr:hypothetical protein [Novosphingobium sp. FKTRR1]